MMFRPAAIAAFLVALLLAHPALAANGKLEVWFIDVGQGDGALVSTPSGKTMLVDAGPPEAAGRVAAFVREHVHGPLDVAVVSHPHADHIGGMLASLKLHGVRDYYDPVLDNPSRLLSDLYRFVSAGSKAGSLTAHRVRAGATEPITFADGVRVEFLGPEEPLLRGTRSDVNANSIVLRVSLGDCSVLFAGDAEADTERQLVALHRDHLRATALKVPHHGSKYASGPEFLAAVAPKFAVISAGANNEYHHPHRPTLARLADAGAQVVRTDVSGTIYLQGDAHGCAVAPLAPEGR